MGSFSLGREGFGECVAEDGVLAPGESFREICGGTLAAGAEDCSWMAVSRGRGSRSIAVEGGEGLRNVRG